MFLVTLYMYNNIQEVLLDLQETNFLQKISKVFMSHCSKSSFPKRYKITILVITFLFWSGFQVWEIQKKFCRKFLIILKHKTPLTDWNGPVKCQNLFWTVWHDKFESPVKQVWGSNKSCLGWFCQWAPQIHYICPTESI